MTEPASFTARMIDALYAEGLMLSDDVRAAFDLSACPPRLSKVGRSSGASVSPAARDLALSCEALRTTTRIMHAVAWLLNHRAYFRGEISDFQLKRYGRIAANLPTAEPERLALLSPEVRDLIHATERFYARLVRLDTAWREPVRARSPAPAIQRLRERLARAV